MIKKVYPLLIIPLLILTSFVIAAGSSSGNAEDREVERIPSTTSEIESCETQETLRDRIKCRMENPSVAYREAYQAVEEACRDNRYKERCENLYKNSAKCYNEDNLSERKRCFLNESGISFNAQGTFRAAPDENKRNYVVLLLYELQERIEDMQSDGNITVDQATSLVEKIVEIKRMILAKEPRSEIVVKINEFKQEYRTVLTGVKK